MRRPLALAFLSCALQAACEPPLPAESAVPGRAIDATAARADVGRLLDGFHAAAARADEAAYFACFAKDGVFMGTDATERWDVTAFRAYAHPHFARGKAWAFRAKTRTVRIAESGDVAWFDEALDTERLGSARGSGVVVREGGAWKVAHYNLSIPIPNDRFDQARRAMVAPLPLRFDPSAVTVAPPRPSAAEIERAADKLEAEAKAAFAAEKLPSLAFAIVSGGRTVRAKAFGAADVATKRPATTTTAYRIGSITKTLTAAALLALRDGGKLSLGDRLDAWVPEAASLTYAPGDAAPITLRDLVTHSSGLPRLGDFDYTRPDREVTERDLLGALSAALATAPETRYLYSNFGMGLAGLVVARAANEPYRDFVRKRFFAPLRMTHAGFAADEPAVAVDVATGYLTRNARAAATPWRLGASEGAGGIYASVEDMATWLAFQLDAWPPRSTEARGTEILSRASRREGHVMRFFDELTTHSGPAATSASASGVGYAWHVTQTCDFERLVRHGGAIDGFTADVAFAPERDFGLVVLTNTADVSASRIADRLLDVVRTDAESAFGPRAPEPSAALTAAVGRFASTLGAIDEGTYDALFAKNFRTGVPFPVFAATSKSLRDQHGTCTVDARPAEVESSTRATFRLSCTKGPMLALAEVDGSALSTLFVRKTGVVPNAKLVSTADEALGLQAKWDDARATRLLAPALSPDRMKRGLGEVLAEVGACRRTSAGDGDGDGYASFALECGPHRISRELRITVTAEGRVRELTFRTRGPKRRCQ